MKNYADTKRIIDTVESLAAKYGIMDEDLKQDLFLMLLEEQSKKTTVQPNYIINDLISKIELEEECKNLVDNFSDREIEDPNRFEDQLNLKMDVEKLLSVLPSMERTLIETYFGLNGICGIVTDKGKEIVKKSLKKLSEDPKNYEIRYYIFD